MNFIEVPDFEKIAYNCFFRVIYRDQKETNWSIVKCVWKNIVFFPEIVIKIIFRQTICSSDKSLIEIQILREKYSV